VTQTRIQKIIAQAGIASRRKAEEIVLEGRVRVNGKVVTELGFKADPTADRIEVDGKPIEGEPLITILMNKPRGVVSTAKDPEGRPTVMDFVKDIDARIFPVGRLDFATSGALLLTNDGRLSFALTHPKHKVEKIYLVKIEGKVEEAVLKRWREGVELDDGITQPAEVFKSEEDDNFTWLQVTLREGRNRQIRRMAEVCGLNVKKLKRISFAGLTIEGIRVGEYRPVSALEIRKLKEQYHIPSFGVRFSKMQQLEQPESNRSKQSQGEKRRPFSLEAIKRPATGMRGRPGGNRPTGEQTDSGRRPDGGRPGNSGRPGSDRPAAGTGRSDSRRPDNAGRSDSRRPDNGGHPGSSRTDRGRRIEKSAPKRTNRKK
jgi:pseudouridine synthase